MQSSVIDPVRKRTIVDANMRGLMIPFAANDSVNRLILNISAQNQWISVVNGEVPRVDTLYSNSIGKSTFNIRPDGNMKIVKRIDKKIFGKKTMRTFFIMVDDIKKEISCHEHKDYITTNEDYGFINDAPLKDKNEGDMLLTTEHIQKSANWKPDGLCWGGVNATTTFNISHTTIEDSILISTDLQKRLSFLKVVQMDTALDLNNMSLKNLFGDVESYKPILLIGDKVPDNDIALALADKPAVHQSIKIPSVSYDLGLKDTPFYIPSGSEVVDIEILATDEKYVTDKFLLLLYREQKRYYDEILSAIKEVVQYHPGYSQSMDIISMVDRLSAISEGAGFRRDKNVVAKNNVIIGMTFKKICLPERGHKITNRHGGKGVMSEEQETESTIEIAGVFDKELYKNEFGVAVDCILNTKGVPNRSNMGQLYERTTNNFLDTAFMIYRGKRERGEDYADAMYETIMGILSRIAPEQYDTMYEFMKGKNTKNVMDDILNNDMVVYINPYPEEAHHPAYVDNVLKRFAECEKYLLNRGIPVGKIDVYMTHRGKKVKLPNKMEVSRMYMIALEHSPDKKFVLRTLGAQDGKGGLVKTVDRKLRQVRYNNTPVKLGERDLLLLTSLLGKKQLYTFLNGLESESVDTLRAFFNAHGVDFIIDKDVENEVFADTDRGLGDAYGGTNESV